MDDETFERIPWEHLSPPKNRPSLPPARLMALFTVGAIAVAGVVAVVWSRPALAPPSTTLAAPTTTTASVTTTSLLSESSLEALPNVESEAAAWAEWLTELYLTVDGSEHSELALILPPNAPLPVPAAGQRIFVESARTVATVEEGAEHRATVVARLLGAVGQEPYRRLPDRALVWTLRWSPEGWIVTDLPEEVVPPSLQPGPAYALGPVPEPVLSAAEELGGVVGGALAGDFWRVVITFVDPLGGSWPVLAWFHPDGTRVPVAAASG